MWTSMRRSVKWKIGRASSDPLVMRHCFASGEIFFGEADFLFSSIPLNPIPPNLTKSSSAIKNSRKGKSRDSWQHFL